MLSNSFLVTSVSMLSAPTTKGTVAYVWSTVESVFFASTAWSFSF